MSLSRSQLQYVLVSFVVIPSIANTAINLLLGWGTFYGVEKIPLWSLGPSVGTDLLGTCYFLPAVTCLIVTPTTRRHVRLGKVEPLPELTRIPQCVQWAFRRVIWRCAVFGLPSLAIAGSAVAAGLAVVAANEIALMPFLVFKVVFSVVLGIIVTPLIGLAAMADPLLETQPG